MKTRLFLLGLFGAFFLLIPPASHAQSNTTGWGPHFGVTVDPDQVHVGMHLHFGTRGEGVRFQPNFDIGFGDDITLIALNFDVVYRFRGGRADWAPFIGGGLGANFYDWDDDRFDPGDNFDDEDVEPGFNIVGGVDHGVGGGNRFYIEGKLGLIDAPDLKLTVGWTLF